ncbi:MAG: hypothetical protein Q4G07_10620 [Oscillospiraceae bacterium]|nr:hypothetical protein [Oscillospiraceae bacterium]
MGSGMIHVNITELNQQITALQVLCSSTELADEISSIQNILQQSKGESAYRLSVYGKHLDGIRQQLDLLFTHTLNFLNNAGTTFVETDEGIAASIQTGGNS